MALMWRARNTWEAAQPTINTVPAALSDSALSFPSLFFGEAMEKRNPNFINTKCKSSIQDGDMSTERLFLLWAGNVSILLQVVTADFLSHMTVLPCV